MSDCKPRVLIIAEAANPEWASVPLIGWCLSDALRAVADVHLVTQVRNKDALLRAGLIEGVDFTALDTEPLVQQLSKLIRRLNLGWTFGTAIYSIAYPWFEHLLWKRFRADIKAGKFDIVHRVTPLSPTANSLIARRCEKIGVPFIMGPLNGGVPWPRAFDRERRQEREWLSYVRGFYKLIPGRRATLSAASAIIAGSSYTKSEIPAQYQDKCIFLPENAIDPERFNKTANPPSKLPLRGCFIGRLVPYKGPDILLEAAVPLLKTGQLILDIIGDGPMMGDLKALSLKLGVEDGVIFHGWLNHKVVQDIAAKSHLMTFPSIREFGGGVVLEALALGVVPVTVDYAGPGDLMKKPGIGFTVPIGTRVEIVSDLRACLQAIAADPANLAAMAKNGQRHVREHFTWSAKAAQISEIYQWVLGNRHEKPNPMNRILR